METQREQLVTVGSHESFVGRRARRFPPAHRLSGASPGGGVPAHSSFGLGYGTRLQHQGLEGDDRGMVSRTWQVGGMAANAIRSRLGPLVSRPPTEFASR